MNPRTVDVRPAQPRVLDDSGRLVVPRAESRGPNDPSPLEVLGLVADVLRKTVDVRLGSETYEWVLVDAQDPHGSPYVLELDVPIDLHWLRQRAVLPAGMVLDDVDPRHAPAVRYYGHLIRSSHRGDSAQWREAGWVDGQPWSGERPGPRGLGGWLRWRRGQSNR